MAPASHTPELQAIRKRIAILDALVALRREGCFRAIWCNEDRLQIQYGAGPHDPVFALRWDDAERMARGELPARSQAPAFRKTLVGKRKAVA